MKVAVYSIAKNESLHVERWANSASDADGIFLTDTGSTDNTVALAKTLGIETSVISISPWRFDDARNASLAQIPNDFDFCICLDLDEILIPGWRRELEKAFERGVTRPSYSYLWSVGSDGLPSTSFNGNKIHMRHGYRWKYAIHEILVPDRIAEKSEWVNLEIHHLPDSTKSRSEYLPLLQTSVKENPGDSRLSYYLGREYFFANESQLAIVELKRYLALGDYCWGPERSSALRMLGRLDFDNAEKWFLEAIDAAPHHREGYVALANLYFQKEYWSQVFHFANLALEITVRNGDFITDPESWGYLPHDLCAISAFNLKNSMIAIKQGKLALDKAPESERARLEKNLDFYLGENQTLRT